MWFRRLLATERCVNELLCLLCAADEAFISLTQCVYMDTASPSSVTQQQQQQQQLTSREMICHEAETRALFAALDKDRNGFIDKTELRATMSEVGLQLSDDDIDTMMKAAGVVIKDRIFYEGYTSLASPQRSSHGLVLKREWELKLLHGNGKICESKTHSYRRLHCAP